MEIILPRGRTISTSDSGNLRIPILLATESFADSIDPPRRCAAVRIDERDHGSFRQVDTLTSGITEMVFGPPYPSSIDLGMLLTKPLKTISCTIG